MKKPIRLQKYLAQCGIASRRKAENLIAQGLVQVDGRVVKEMGTLIIPGVNTVTYQNQDVALREPLVYYLLNKPKGYITSLSDPQGRPVVTSLIKGENRRLFPVGRLDLDTEGALILTNDGSLTQKIQHPKHQTFKTYQALVKGKPNPAKLKKLETGIELEGKLTAPAKVALLTTKPSSSLVKITIHEGKKRQVKKMFGAIGHPVIHLKRTAYGKLHLGKLETGQYRQLNRSELKKIFL